MTQQNKARQFLISKLQDGKSVHDHLQILARAMSTQLTDRLQSDSSGVGRHTYDTLGSCHAALIHSVVRPHIQDASDLALFDGFYVNEPVHESSLRSALEFLLEPRNKKFLPNDEKIRASVRQVLEKFDEIYPQPAPKFGREGKAGGSGRA